MENAQSGWGFAGPADWPSPGRLETAPAAGEAGGTVPTPDDSSAASGHKSPSAAPPPAPTNTHTLIFNLHKYDGEIELGCRSQSGRATGRFSPVTRRFLPPQTRLPRTPGSKGRLSRFVPVP